jgi:hypothetical protein
MVSIGVELLRGDRVATATPTLAPPEDTKGNFARSLLANGVESAPKPATAETRANKNVVANVAGVSKKSATTGQDFATGSMNYEESESGLNEANGSSMPFGVRSTAMAKDQRTAKDEPVGNTTEVKEVDGSEVKKPGLFEASKVSVPERAKLKVSETKDPKIDATKLARAKAKNLDGSVTSSGPVADETRMGDTVSVQSVTPGNGRDVPQNNLKDSDVLPTIPSGRGAGDKHSESAMTASPIAQRETKGTQDDGNHPVTPSEGSSDSVPTVTANVEQAKNGAVAVSADLAGSGAAAGAGKAEVGIGSVIAAVQHVGTDLPGQGSTASFGRGVHQGSTAELTPSVGSHNVTYSGEQMATGESRPGLLGATPTSLEVGIANGTHGWLKIRAEMEGGVVTASLSPGSMAGQEMLHRELPSLAAYLQEEKLGVNTLVLKPAEMPDSMGTNSGGSLQRQGQSSQQQSDGARDGIGAGDKSGVGGAQQRPIYEGWNGFDGGFLPSMADNVGGWLNVRV